MLEITLPVAGISVSLWALALLGLGIGFVSGLFGVGGGFLMVPLLAVIFRVPWNVAAGSSLGVILGTAVVGSFSHRRLGNIDARLVGLILLGTFGGVRLGTWILELLKHSSRTLLILGREIPLIDATLSGIFILLLAAIGSFMIVEGAVARRGGADARAADNAAVRFVHGLKLPPRVSLPVSGVASIPIWLPALMGLAIGGLCGLLGVGGGFVSMPCLIYVFGIPTAVAVGSDLFQMVFTSAWGCFEHARAGNVDYVLVAGVLLGSVFGVRAGAALTGKLKGASIRFYFGFVAYAGAGLLIAKLAGLFGA